MSGFIPFFAKREFLARILTFMVLVMGAASLYNLNLQEYPDVALESAEINVSYPGSTAQDVELNITNLLEKEIQNVQGLKTFESESSDGLVKIEAEVRAGEDTPRVMRDLQQAVDRVNGLPSTITSAPTVVQRQTSSIEVFTFGVSMASGNVDYSLLQPYARKLEKAIRALSGVNTVTMSGFNDREFWVEINPEKVSRYQLTYNDILGAIRDHNLSVSGGVVESWQSQQKIVTMTQVKSAEELGHIVVKMLPGGGVVHVYDVASVTDTFDRASQMGVINGKESILFSISNSGSSDIISTVNTIKSYLEEEKIKTGNKFEFQYGMNVADDMNDKFTIVATNGAIGLVLVLLVLSLILKRQIAFWVSVSIPFCVLGVMIVLPAAGLNLDSITLAALLLVMGIIVDDSVIVAESIYQEKEKGKPALQAAVDGTRQVIKPILASLITTALVFIPMFFISGSMGKVVAVIPITVISALLFSLAECSFTLPAHLAHTINTGQKRDEEKDRFEGIRQRYRCLLKKAIRFKKSVILVAMLATVACSGLVTNLKVDIFPTEAAKYIEVYTEVTPGTSLEKVREMHATLEQAIMELPTNELVAYELTYSAPVTEGTLTLTSFENRTRSAHQIVASLNEKIKGKHEDIFVKLAVTAGGPPPGEPIEVRVMGGNKEERDQAVSIVTSWLAQQESVYDITHNELLKDPQLKVVPQYEWMARYGVTVSELASTLRMAFEGEAVTSTWLQDEEIDIRVVLEKEYRDIGKLSQAKITTPTGQQVPLARLAKVEHIDVPRMILHYNGVTNVLVSAQLTADAPSSVALTSQMLNELNGKYSPNVIIGEGGEAEETNQSLDSFIVAFPVAMAAIYFVLAVMFSSLLQPLLVMAVIPFSTVAALMALVVHMQSLSMFALIGVLGMAGVVVNNSLVLINRVNELREEGHTVHNAVINAAVSRFRPILLTSVTTVVGLLPLAYGLGGTDVYMGPMSLTLGYGLLLSLPVVLFVVPALYVLCIREKK
ncbi:efflux RND transporter permease subunit [Vibrio tasmaniensis]|uniref:efflux RND transporter permease subunit n=1 Tax=Vibrio tasmaniensis TaxID=212663 RepID=UPI00107F9C1F|nr:efflux RND transporter permease subunit [Vibrio tasmaniensis]